MKLLVIGNSVRSIVCSAKRAGYTVYALDNFCDVDMRSCADKAASIANMDMKKIFGLVGSFGEFDGVILGPGFEELEFDNILGNTTEVGKRVNDKLELAQKMLSLGIPHPETEPLARAAGLRFPLMIKPRCGSGGMRNITVKDEDELAEFQARRDAGEFIAQEFIRGIPCSASLIGTGDYARVIALNEQLIGDPRLTRLPFAYCGNVTPFVAQFKSEMVKYSEHLVQEFNLIGSNGVDLIQTENGMVVIEINPRFQGSLDTIEMSSGINVFDAHVRSFSGELPEPVKYMRFAIKNILYADMKIVVGERLSGRLNKCLREERAADVPEKGRKIGKDEPLTTLFGTGGTREIAARKLEKTVSYIKGSTEV